MRRKVSPEDVSETGQGSSQLALGIVGGFLVLKLRRRKHMLSGTILKRSCCCEGHDLHGEELYMPQLLRPVCPVWPVVQERVVVGDSIVPPFQSPSLIRHLRSRAAEKLGAHSLSRGAA